MLREKANTYFFSVLLQGHKCFPYSYITMNYYYYS